MHPVYLLTVFTYHTLVMIVTVSLILYDSYFNICSAQLWVSRLSWADIKK